MPSYCMVLCSMKMKNNILGKRFFYSIKCKINSTVCKWILPLSLTVHLSTLGYSIAKANVSERKVEKDEVGGKVFGEKLFGQSVLIWSLGFEFENITPDILGSIDLLYNNKLSAIWRQNILELLHFKLLHPPHFWIRFLDRIRLFCTVYKLPF